MAETDTILSTLTLSAGRSETGTLRISYPTETPRSSTRGPTHLREAPIGNMQETSSELPSPLAWQTIRDGASKRSDITHYGRLVF